MTDHQQSRWYEVGAAAELERLIDELVDESGRHWACGREVVAGYLRDTLVPRLRDRAKGHRRKQAKALEALRQEDDDA